MVTCLPLAILKTANTSSPSTEQGGIPTPISKTPIQMIQTPKTPALQIRDNISSPHPSKKTPLNVFTPTSVLKKMHNEKKVSSWCMVS